MTDRLGCFRTNALLVGRPTSISDAHTDTKEPANLDDEELESPDFDPRGHSLIKPTEYTQVILRHRLAQIMGRISDHSQSPIVDLFGQDVADPRDVSLCDQTP